MPSTDREIFEALHEWATQGRGGALATVVRTYGSSPRPAGSMVSIRDDGAVVGSVSGGCVEQDLIGRVGDGTTASPQLLSYGGTPLENQRLGLPCGGRLEIFFEPRPNAEDIAQLCAAIASSQAIARRVRLANGKSETFVPSDGTGFAWDGETLITVHRPQLRLLIVGAVHTACYLAEMAQALEYAVSVCDPRDEYRATWRVIDAPIVDGMPDDVVRAMAPDSRTAIIALTHDPKLDDMALMEALRGDAFYIGALGSGRNQTKRRERLALLDLAPEQIAKLRGPVGLPIGSHTPAEIAVAILADLIAVRNGVELARAEAQPSQTAVRAALSA